MIKKITKNIKVIKIKMQAQLVSLEDSKLMKIITLDEDIWRKIWFSSANHIFDKNCETNYTGRPRF